MNARLDSAGHRVFSGAQILIGGNGKYLAMCPDCFYRETPAARQGLRPHQAATECAS